MEVQISKKIGIEINDIAEAMDIKEMLFLICRVADRLGKEPFAIRRNFAYGAADYLSENGKAFLAEILAAEYSKNALGKED